ncbi:MAG: sterol desaturase family protein [Deltaproteobacteria bacterium]|nr:sterol desaturase family protein [Deltaproteobacteria bacterium]
MVDVWIMENANSAQVALFFALFAVLALVETVAPARPRSPQPKKRWGTNLALTTVNIFVLSLFPITFFGAAIWAQAHGYGLLNLLSPPFEVLVVATLSTRGFISFFTHYLMHKVEFLWRLHRVHHFDTELDVTSTVRFHPLEFVAALVPGVAVVVAVGMSPWVLLLYELLDAGVTLFSHANIRLPRSVERVLRYVIVTPDLHRVHHSSWQPETDSNFSAVFPIWDVICGTFRTETRVPHATMELGLEVPRDERTDRFFWLLGSPFFRVESRARPAFPYDRPE